MASRAKVTTVRIETEIEKNREESNWAKVIELAEQLKDRSSDFEYLSNFLIGEGRLESYLEEWPPVEANIKQAVLGLKDARKYLQLASNEHGKKAGVALDAHLLLGKLHYACGQYADGLANYKLAELHALPEKKLPLRSLKIVAESFAIKGLCLQKDTAFASTKFKRAERDEEMLKCFNIASDLGLLYMQEFEKQQSSSYTNTGGSYSPQPTASHKILSPVIEQALQQAPALCLQNVSQQSPVQATIVNGPGATSAVNAHNGTSSSTPAVMRTPLQALDRFRNSLTAVESPGVNAVRLKLMCQLAELLLQGSFHAHYKAPSNGSIGASGRDSPWKPRFYSGLNQFVPSNVNEETLLVLLVAESIAVRYAVLSQSPEFKEARLSAYHDAAAVYDLLTLATVRWGQVALLQAGLEAKRSRWFMLEQLEELL